MSGRKTILFFQSGLCASNNAKLEGVFRYARAAHWRVQVVQYADAMSSRAQVRGGTVPDVRALVDFWKPIGAIVECGSTNARLTARDFRGLPVVFLDHGPTKGAVCVSCDDEKVAELVARKLLALDFAAYGYVPFAKDAYWNRKRAAVFAELVQMNGRDCLEFKENRSGEKDADRQTRLCAWLKSVPRPFGVFAANDFVAQSVLSCAGRAGLRVPDDLSVVGVDNDPQICEHTSPALTSIALDVESAGYIAAELLAERISSPRRRLADRKFGVLGICNRESVKAFQRHDVRVDAALEYIRRHACEGIRSRDVLPVMKCSRRLAELRFREVTGHSILEEIHSVRLEKAKYLLAYTRDAVGAIAKACGYSTTEQLRRLFLTAEGVSMRAWRIRRVRVAQK